MGRWAGPAAGPQCRGRSLHSDRRCFPSPTAWPYKLSQHHRRSSAHASASRARNRSEDVRRLQMWPDCSRMLSHSCRSSRLLKGKLWRGEGGADEVARGCHACSSHWSSVPTPKIISISRQYSVISLSNVNCDLKQVGPISCDWTPTRQKQNKPDRKIQTSSLRNLVSRTTKHVGWLS